MFRDAADQTLLHLRELLIHRVVCCNDLFGQHYITFYVGVYAFCHHLYDCLGHFPEKRVVFRLPVAEKTDDLRNILRLIADTLHIGDHFQCGGNLPQIPCHRLLLKQQPQAQVFDFPLLMVDLAVQRADLGRQCLILCQGP